MHWLTFPQNVHFCIKQSLYCTRYCVTQLIKSLRRLDASRLWFLRARRCQINQNLIIIIMRRQSDFPLIFHNKPNYTELFFFFSLTAPKLLDPFFSSNAWFYLIFDLASSSYCNTFVIMRQKWISFPSRIYFFTEAPFSTPCFFQQSFFLDTNAVMRTSNSIYVLRRSNKIQRCKTFLLFPPTIFV